MTRRTLLTAGICALALIAPAARGDYKNVIVLTGYWPPSNEMLRPFSANQQLNPNGWIGQNWENRGFDVFAYFPTFPDPECDFCGRGSGDFEVDYQDTAADFWPIMNGRAPVAIITTSRTGAGYSWEFEMNAYNNEMWVNDYDAPLQPTPSPPDDTVPAGFLRTSTLPMQAMIDAVNAAPLGLNAFICESQSAGAFLSGFIGYHGMWYQSIHAAPEDSTQCVAAGHLHVGELIDWETAREATKVSLRVLIDHVRSVVGAGGADIDADGSVSFSDLLIVLSSWGECDPPPAGCPADIDGNGVVGFEDLLEVLSAWG